MVAQLGGGKVATKARRCKDSPEVDAPREAKAGKPKTPRKGRPTLQRRRVPCEAVEVYRALPSTLAGQIPEHGSRRVLEAIAGELLHRSVAELANRIARNWEYFRYRISLSEPVRDPVAVDHPTDPPRARLPRRAVRDGHQLDLDAPCRACEDQGAALTASRSLA